MQEKREKIIAEENSDDSIADPIFDNSESDVNQYSDIEIQEENGDGGSENKKIMVITTFSVEHFSLKWSNNFQPSTFAIYMK